MNKELFSPSGQRFLEARDFLLENRTNYKEAYEKFKWPELPYFNWALDYFDPMAKTDPDKIALWIVSENSEAKYTFGDLSRRSNQIANFLIAQGVKPFDRIMLMLPNNVEMYECILAAIKIRAIIVPTSTALSKEDIAYRLNQANIEYVITLDSETTKLDQLRENISFKGIVVGEKSSGWVSYTASENYSEVFKPTSLTKKDDPLFYYFTSGTTSKPKLVGHTHQSYTIGHLPTMYWLGLKDREDRGVQWTLATPGWAKSMWAFFATLNAGACIFIYLSQRFDPHQFLNTLVKYPITSLCAPPTVWRSLKGIDLKKYQTHLKGIMSAGEPLNPEIITDVKNAWGVDIREGYGQTETTAVIGYCPGQTVIPGTMGYVLPGYKVTLVNEQGEEANEGELVINMQPPPLGVMPGYQDQTKTQEVMRDCVYHTGDRLARNQHTFFFIGRIDDVFKSSGYRISPFELESKLVEHPAILEAAVVPSPHPIKGAIPKAFVVLRKGFEPTAEQAKEIFEFLDDKLPKTHRIQFMQFFDRLPQTPSGKTLRKDLKKLEESKSTSPYAISPTFNETAAIPKMTARL